MKYYLYNTNENEFMSFVANKAEGDAIWDAFSNRIRLAEHAGRFAFRAVHPPARPQTYTDFPAIGNNRYFPILSQRAWECLSSLLGPYVEVLPLDQPEGGFLLVDIVEAIPAIDEDCSVLWRSEIDRQIHTILEYAFDEAVIGDRPIFKTPLAQGAMTYVDQRFRDIVEANNLQGLLFNDLPMVGDG